MFVSLLGLRHGMDPDHIAAVNHVTHFNVGSRPRLARFAGCLFSLGHGMVVVLIAVLVGTIAGRWRVPSWFEGLGALASAGVLLAFGVATLWAVLRTPAGHSPVPRGLKSFWLPKAPGHPLVLVLIGALFALSFDTLSLAVLFAITASSMAGWPFLLVLGACFTAGMALTDGLNGWWMGRLLHGDGERTAAARAMSCVIGCLGVGVGILSGLEYLYVDASAFHGSGKVYLGAALVAVTTTALVLAGRKRS